MFGKSASLVYLVLLGLAAAQTECPELPDTGVDFGQPVPMKPEDIPAGCSDYEILVGKSFPTKALMIRTNVASALKPVELASPTPKAASSASLSVIRSSATRR